MQFKVKCPLEPPCRPNGTAETNFVSLYVYSEKPQRGINLVTSCLSLAFLTGASNFASNQGVVVTDLAALNRYVEGLGDKFRHLN